MNSYKLYYTTVDIVVVNIVAVVNVVADIVAVDSFVLEIVAVDVVRYATTSVE